MDITILFWSIILIVLQGCTHQPGHLDIEASKHGFSTEIIQGSEFQHVIYIQDGAHNSSILHVYLDGDGQPWIDNSLVSADPTPINPMMLNLMAIDQAPGIYLGRPCYHGFSTIPPCDPGLWTSARYSLRVVKSMERALLDYMARAGYSEAVLIGYSGGGTLAMLLAERVNATRAVVTISGNLDIDSWTEHHGYSPLKGSINPAHLSRLDPEILQYHLIGKADRNVPYHLVEQVLRTQSNARVLVWEKFDHDCCWHTIWPEFLPDLEN